MGTPRQLLDIYIDNMKKYFPNLEFGNAFSLYNGDNPSNFDFEFLQNNAIIKGTGYDIIQPQQVIHYTSIKAAIDIIQSQCIRLSQVNSLNDPHEIKYINKIFNIGIKESELEEYRRNLFVASFCEFDKNNTDYSTEFPMWRTYGKEGKGVSLVFDIENSNEEISHYYIGKIQYDNDHMLTNLQNAIHFHHAFINDNPSVIRNKYPIALLVFILMHKYRIWNYENEIRIATNFSFDKYTLKEKNFGHKPVLAELKTTVNEKGNPINYLELPFVSSNKCDMLLSRLKEMDKEYHFKQMLPHLKLKSIFIGYQVDDIEGCIQVINENLKEYSYHIPIYLSPLRQYFS